MDRLIDYLDIKSTSQIDYLDLKSTSQIYYLGIKSTSQIDYLDIKMATRSQEVHRYEAYGDNAMRT